jgi:hypothetical protein
VAQRLLDTNNPLFRLADGHPAYYVEDLSLLIRMILRLLDLSSIVPLTSGSEVL